MQGINFISSLEMCISRLEMYIFRLEMCISRLEIEFSPYFGNFSYGFRRFFPVLPYQYQTMPNDSGSTSGPFPFWKKLYVL